MRQFPVFAHNMLRKFPINGPMLNQQQMPFMPPQMNPMNNIPDIGQMDPNTKREFFGEKLYQKISINPAFNKFQE